ncbi:MAG: KOW motif-containing protein [Candidatus Electryoneaceae bacterium]|nr:KOW motif-containing protein [Candidatus Electryoneaceae bacterium]
MSKVKKQIGDSVLITAGQHKNEVGIIVEKERHSWTIELEDGSRITASFAMVALVEPSTQTEPMDEVEVITEAESTVVEAEASREADPTAVSEAESTTETPDDELDVTKMTVKQLQALAKQRGIGIARTKSDFLRIIKEKNPEEDLDQLNGKTLFNRISELHISRLRTKVDLIQIFQNF